jgi:hypothetical protein
MGLARNELMTASVKRVGLHSPLFARRTIFFATDIPMYASGSATFNRFNASSKAVIHGRSIFGTERCFDFQKGDRHIAYIWL